MTMTKEKTITKKLFTLFCRECGNQRQIAGNTGNPPKVYCCRREMRIARFN